MKGVLVYLPSAGYNEINLIAGNYHGREIPGGYLKKRRRAMWIIRRKKRWE
jgi:hypothetical protein